MNEQVNLEKHCNEMMFWLTELADYMRVPGRTDWAYKALKAVLHTVRDRTTIQEVFHLSAQLPLLIRGIYFEGYKPEGKPEKMNAQEFMERINLKIKPSVETPALEVFRAVLFVLYDKISPGELDDIRASMPKDLQKLWENLMTKETEVQ